MRIAQLLLAAALVSAGSYVAAQRLPVPVVNHDRVELRRPDGQVPSAEEVHKAIMAGAVATGRKWTVVENEPGRLTASYQVRTHTVVSEIRYGAGQLSLRYADSINMKFAPDGNTGVIHPFYNQWVQELLQAIRLELGKP